jgi:hypothetical protein
MSVVSLAVEFPTVAPTIYTFVDFVSLSDGYEFFELVVVHRLYVLKDE